MNARNLLHLGVLLAVFFSCRTFQNTDHLIDSRYSKSIKSRRPILIAHRGGHITKQSPECSIAAIKMAAQKGYAMVELEGSDAGRFDHIVWVTMKDDKPVFANLDINGIWDQDIVTEEMIKAREAESE